MAPPKQRQASLNHFLAGPALTSLPKSTQGDIAEAEDHARALLELSIALIDAALDIIEHHIRTDEELQRPSQLMPGGTVGKHFRHVIEMFQAFLLPLQGAPDMISSSPMVTIEINYDAPLPNSRRSIARSLPACRSAMKDIRQGLQEWDESSRTSIHRGVPSGAEKAGLAVEMQRRVRLVAVTPTQQVMESSVGRELWFCSLHAIHHFSMLRTIAVHELGLSLPVEFGTAPSTLLYRAQDSKPSTDQHESSQSAAKSKL